MSKLSPIQREVLTILINGGQLYREYYPKIPFYAHEHLPERKRISLATFRALLFKRYIDPNGINIKGRDYYKLSEKGLEALK